MLLIALLVFRNRNEYCCCATAAGCCPPLIRLRAFLNRNMKSCNKCNNINRYVRVYVQHTSVGMCWDCTFRNLLGQVVSLGFPAEAL